MPKPPAPEHDDSQMEDIFTTENPIGLFGEWLDAAWQAEIADANAMSLATADTSGFPNVRFC